MHEKHLYEYAVIRAVPRVEREEFLNVGVVLFSKKARFLQAKTTVDRNKLRLLAPDFDVDQLIENLTAFENICNGNKTGGPIAQFDAPSRFRWLTAIRSSAVQTSRPHPGLSDNLDVTLNRLFEEMVL